MSWERRLLRIKHDCRDLPVVYMCVFVWTKRSRSGKVGKMSGSDVI